MSNLNAKKKKRIAQKPPRNIRLEDAWTCLVQHYFEPNNVPESVDDVIDEALAIADRSPWVCAEVLVEIIDAAIAGSLLKNDDAAMLRPRLKKFACRARVSHLNGLRAGKASS